MAANDNLWDSADDEDLLMCDIPDDLPARPTSQPEFKKSTTLPVTASKKNAWISSSFDGFNDFGQSSQPQKSRTVSRKRPREPEQKVFQRKGSFSKSKKPVTDQIWAEKYNPKTQNDLAVHKKKIAEVQAWIEASLRHSARGRLCLLTGPAGAGKTATVKALVYDLGLELQEWSNPLTTSSEWNEDFVPTRPDFVPIGGSSNETQSGKFRDFLLRANRYPSLQMGNENLSKKIILIEEIPNFFSRDIESFHHIIRQHCRSGTSPLLFILSDNASGESAERKLFPKQLQADLDITNISFNPVAATSMMKVLQKIASAEALQCASKFQVPEKATLTALSTASAGDIRGAINALQFVCLRGCRNALSAVTQSQRADSQSGRQGKSGSKQKQTTSRSRVQTNSKKKGEKIRESPEDHLAAIGGRDTSLFLFRALGKILYCKRCDPADDPDHVRPPPHLSHHDRDPLLIQPEEVLDKCHLSGEYLTSYLHHNYMGFYQKLDDVVRASEYLSDSDYLTADWVGRATLRNYAASVAGRGLMHANSIRGRSSGGGPSGLGFKPLHKPAWYDIMRKMRDNCQDARSIFAERVQTCPPRELLTQMLPFLAKITNGNGLKSGQGGFLRDVCRMSSKIQFRPGERLDEKDVDGGEPEDIDSTLPVTATGTVETGAAQAIENTAEPEDEELNIDDFDD